LAAVSLSARTVYAGLTGTSGPKVMPGITIYQVSEHNM